MRGIRSRVGSRSGPLPVGTGPLGVAVGDGATVGGTVGVGGTTVRVGDAAGDGVVVARAGVLRPDAGMMPWQPDRNRANPTRRTASTICRRIQPAGSLAMHQNSANGAE